MNNPNLLFTIGAFLLVIGPLIFIHELGHYYAGRLFGVKADTFSIGFGREIFGWTDKRGTRWKVGWMPLGGYVKFKGDMNPASTPSSEWLSLPAAERAETFQAKPLWQRFIIVAAGPFTNFLFAIIAFMIMFATIGYPASRATIGQPLPNSVAANAGFLRTAFSTSLWSGHVPLVKHFLFLFGEKKHLSTLNASGLDIRHCSNSYPINSR